MGKYLRRKKRGKKKRKFYVSFLVVSVFVLSIVSLFLIRPKLGNFNENFDDEEGENIVDPNYEFQESAITDKVQYNISDYNINYGSLENSIGNMNESDSTNTTIKELKYAIDDPEVTLEFPTEDDANLYYIDGNFDSLTASTSFENDGTYCIAAQCSANTGDAILGFDNNTGKAMGLDIVNVTKANFTIRGGAGSSMVLDYVDLHYDDDTYYRYDLSLVLTTTWQTVEPPISLFDPYGGMVIESDVNWVEYGFTSLKNNKYIRFDGPLAGLHSDGDYDSRRLSAMFNFTGIGNHDNYVANLSAYKSWDTTYGDDFFTEDSNDWNSTDGITLSNDSANADFGTNAMKAVWDGNGNDTIWFDNQTGKNMQADFSNYNVYYVTTWGNYSYYIEWARWYTTEEDYFEIELDVAYETTPTEYRVPLIDFNEIGNPTRSNISWYSIKINNISNTAPLTFWFDHQFLSDNDNMDFDVYSDGDGVIRVEHTDDYYTTTLSLNDTEIRNNGFVYILLNDTERRKDYFNTSIYVDVLCITGWNETNTYPDIENHLQCTNLDDTEHLYSRKRAYLFTINASDAEGYSDISYVKWGERYDGDWTFSVKYNVSANEWVEVDGADTIELINSSCDVSYGGNDLNTTFAIKFNWNITFRTNVLTRAIVEDNNGANETHDYGETWDIVNLLDYKDLAISDTRYDPGTTHSVTGVVFYHQSDSYLAPPSDEVDMAVINDQGLAKKYDYDITAGGSFNVQDVPSRSDVGVTTYTVHVYEEGETSDCLAHVCGDVEHQLEGISDRIVVESIETPENKLVGQSVTVEIECIYDYDNLEYISGTLTVNGYEFTYISGNWQREFEFDSATTLYLNSSVAGDYLYDLTEVYHNEEASVEWILDSSGSPGGNYDTTTTTTDNATTESDGEGDGLLISDNLRSLLVFGVIGILGACIVLGRSTFRKSVELISEYGKLN